MNSLFEDPMKQDKGLIHTVWCKELQEQTVVLCVNKSAVDLQTRLNDEIWESLRADPYYCRIIEELQEQGETILKKDEVKYKLQSNQLFVHHERKTRTTDEDYWKRLIPDDEGIKMQILRELHSVPYSGHWGFNKTLK